MKKIIIFILILCSTPITLLFGASTKLDNPAQPEINPVQITLASEQTGPPANETIKSAHPKLKYRGTLLLNSPHPAFGGFSDLLVSKDRKTFLAVSDMGFWLKGSLLYTQAGFLKGVGPKAELGQLLNTEGKTFTVKYDADAEALCRAPGRTPHPGYLLAFERVHRINHYYSGKKMDLSGKATTLPLPEQLKNSPLNGGIETMLLLPDNTLFALTEGDDSAGPFSEAALLSTGKWTSFKYKRNSSYRPTSAGNLLDGRILILERKYEGPGTLGIRFCTIDRDKIKQGATLEPEIFCEINLPIPRDNYEGMDIISDPDGRQWIYIISDDNFSPVQHTLLSLFELNIAPFN
ncbi:esterase-like activity of phytase family protein [Desulfovibrio sp. JC022]|uniref:esterase-like activity of phytase family protein n=1 Tax=Desulfovibrio sp. JC022 TaxID=2593642 RepID=UPI0013D81A47|nr:esterase-like activity of phytase family protein [Desulfovibrio sp. JC022]NDV21976.1 esterase-like activity of phytase family protein [Desulfovibrio sp. JC022]